MLRVTLISDTHTKHDQITTSKSIRNSNRLLDLPGGDLLIHAGDFMSSGWNEMEAMMFFKWFDEIDNYDTKVFIAGNHDRWMQNEPEESRGILTGYKTIEYLEDDWLAIYNDGPNGEHEADNIRIYGSPWQPEFYNWAFNLPRNGEELKARWDAIPSNTDILVTHGPAWGFLDDVEGRRGQHLGCELLTERIKEIKPKIHICGHIHSGHGHYFDGHTHFFNASLLDEQYRYTQMPWTFDWNPDTNEIHFI
jgi:Icc-related predicted phosphoesterase